MHRCAVFLFLLGISWGLGQPSGELVVALPNDPTSLFMPRGADITAGNAGWSLYNGLLWLNDEGDMVPALAESYEVSPDGTAYTFKLRKGVSFHNGEPFTAASVVATWETGKDPSNDYADNYARVSDIEVIDDYTVVLKTTEPNALFLSQVAAGWAMVPPVYIREVGLDEFAAKPVGTGPFKFVERAAGDRIVMEANPDYWEAGLPKVAKLTYRIIPDSTTRLAAIQTGEVHIVNRLSADEVTMLEGASNVSVITYPNDRVYYVAFKNIGNGTGTPLEDVKVRQALNYAVNRPGIVEAIFAGQASLISGFNIESNLGYNPAVQPYPYDVEQAKALLSEAGYAEGFEISMGCPADAYLNINEVCLAVQRSLSNVGIDVSVEFQTSNRYWSEAGYGTVGPMYVDSWSSSTGEALGRLQGALIPGNYYNTWTDETIVDYINKITVTVDRKARAKLYSELQQYMYDNPPFIYLYAPNAFEAISNKIEGYKPRANEGYFLKAVSVSQ